MLYQDLLSTTNAEGSLEKIFVDTTILLACAELTVYEVTALQMRYFRLSVLIWISRAVESVVKSRKGVVNMNISQIQGYNVCLFKLSISRGFFIYFCLLCCSYMYM